MDLTQLNALYPNLSGPGVPLGTYLNQLSMASNTNSGATAAAATVTIAGTPHAGDVITTRIAGVAVVRTSLTVGVQATVSVALASCQIGDVGEITLDGDVYVYEMASAVEATEAEAWKVILNADARFNETYIASRSGDSLVIKTIDYVVNTKAISTNVGGAGHTTTLTRSAATLTLGVVGDDTTTIATGIKNAVNASAAASALVTATSSGAVVTLTAKRKGTAFNANTLTSVVTGTSNTVTSTAEAGTFGGATAGTGADDMILIT